MRWWTRCTPGCPSSSRWCTWTTRAGTRCWPGPRASARASSRRWPAISIHDDPINIQYTSGTTGFPKGATLTHYNILNNGFFVGEGCRYTEADRVCIPVPFYHCFGMVLGNLACTTHGAAIVIPAPAFEPEATLAAVRGRAAARRCTACRPCSSRCSTIRDFAGLRPTARCAPGSWPARRARWRS